MLRASPAGLFPPYAILYGGYDELGPEMSRTVLGIRLWAVIVGGSIPDGRGQKKKINGGFSSSVSLLDVRKHSQILRLYDTGSTSSKLV